MAHSEKSQRYRQPRSVNAISIGLLLLLCAAGYWVYCFGPAYFKYYQVRQLMHEAASRYYKLSYLNKELHDRETTKLMDEMRKKVVEVLGFDDPQLAVQLLINEQSKKVHVVTEYDHTIELWGTQKTRALHFKALGESDYRPNDW